MTALFKLALLLATFAMVTKGRAVEKDTVSCLICMYMGYNLGEIEDGTHEEILAALLASCDTWNSTNWRHLCEGYARDHLEDIYTWMTTHDDDLKPLKVEKMCEDIGACST